MQEGDDLVWFWIGNHEEYDRLLQWVWLRRSRLRSSWLHQLAYECILDLSQQVISDEGFRQPARRASSKTTC